MLPQSKSMQKEKWHRKTYQRCRGQYYSNMKRAIPNHCEDFGDENNMHPDEGEIKEIKRGD